MISHVRNFRKIRQNSQSVQIVIPAKISSLKVKVQNIAKLSNSFHGQTSLKDTTFSVLLSETNFFLIGLRNGLIDS